MKVAVIGAGSWGTTVASLVADKAETVLWARRPELADEINTRHRNARYLPDFDLPIALRAASDLKATISGAGLVVMAVPSHGYRAVLDEASGHLDEAPVVSLTKGIEQGTLLRMSEITAQVLPGLDPSHIGVLTGPNLAGEIMAGQPAASVIATGDPSLGEDLQALFMGPRFRVYTNTDVVGCEAAGSLKNVMAIAAGIATGLGFGQNSMAALLTRALAEVTRMGVAMGGRPLTFSGLAGMGDLVATCMSTQSRNHRVGLGLASGRSLQQIIDDMQMVAEGVKTTSAVLELAERYDVDMPIARVVGSVLHDGQDPKQAVTQLMGRDPKAELHGIG